MKIFLTGASGFLGTEFLKYTKNKKVFIYSLGTTKIRNKNIEICKGRLDGKYDDKLFKCNHLLHLASAGVNDKNISYNDLYKTNVIDSLNLFRNAAKNNCLNWVIAGSSSEYGRVSFRKKKLNKNDIPKPISDYAKTKYIFNKKIISLAKTHKAKLRIMRFFPLYGESEKKHRLYSTVVNRAKKNKNVYIINGNQLRDYLNVKIAVKFLYESLDFTIKKSNSNYQIWHIASGKCSTIESFAKKIYKKFNGKGKIISKTKNNFFLDNLHHCSDLKSIWSCLKYKRGYKKS